MRLIQLTLPACVIGLLTFINNDNALAASIVGNKRIKSESLNEALPVPSAYYIPFEIKNNKSALTTIFSPKKCIHDLYDTRPKLTRIEQKQTQLTIDHVIKRLKADEDFHKLLRLVSMRESSQQQGLVHRLNADLEASSVAWKKTAKLYQENPYHKDASIWQTYGLFGMNSNYFTLVWDNQADPRVLCDAVIDILVYRRAALRVARKAGTIIDCVDINGNKFKHTIRATWETIHRAVSGGKLCPGRTETAATMSKYFRARAEKIGLDPDKTVLPEMFGLEPVKSINGESWDSQEKMVMGLWKEIEG